VAQASVSGPVEFTVSAGDGQGGATHQTSSVTVCAAPEHWGAEHNSCLSPIEFTSNPPAGIDLGQTYTYQVTATHTQGLPLTYNLADLQAGVPRPAGMAINPQTGLVSWPVQAQGVTDGYFSFKVIATDSNGYATPQEVQVNVCIPPANWSEEFGSCRGAVRITSTQPVFGLDVGQTFTYQVVATEAVPEGLPITYSLENVYPESSGLSIDPNTGLISWVAVENPDMPGWSDVQFQITAIDSLGQRESQYGYLTVCTPPLHYVEASGGCE
jgi:hypothetical protein